jgi:DNA-binding PadR family transcriptional regulator
MTGRIRFFARRLPCPIIPAAPYWPPQVTGEWIKTLTYSSVKFQLSLGPVRQEVVLTMLAKEPSQGSQLRTGLDRALGPLGEAMNDGQIYVTLGRLEKAGLITRRAAGAPSADRKVYELTPAGQERVTEWLATQGVWKRRGAGTCRRWGRSGGRTRRDAKERRTTDA